MFNLKKLEGLCLGVDRSHAEKVLSNFPKDGESITFERGEIAPGRLALPRIGHLKNYGLGPALDTHVTWIPREIWIGSEHFSLDEKKLTEPIYSGALNCMPTHPGHISPEQDAQLTRLPAFILKDYEKKIKEVDGVFLIEYEDVFGEKHMVLQEFYLFTHYSDEKPNITVTFSDLVRNDSSPKV